jgi:tRNA threonylcarbamoyladenosine biosynthesis protein TsaB
MNGIIIDTALDQAFAILIQNGEITKVATNEKNQTHAEWLHVALETFPKNELQFIACACGPGSYTGTRIGLASAKGLAFALQLPLIGINNLACIAAAQENTNKYIWPMIDARRMEVFTALYKNGALAKPQTALIINQETASMLPAQQEIIACGNGAFKIAEFMPQTNISHAMYNQEQLWQLTKNHWQAQQFINLAYSQADYAKQYQAAGSLRW